jgi:flagellar basal-body rod protein FlgB
MNDITMSALEDALHGLALRQKAIADNIANVQTPGYLAERVDFETSLRDALGSGMRDAVVPTMTRSLDPTRQDGNNVNLDDETVGALETNLRYQTTIDAVNAKFRLLRSAITGNAS